MPVAWNLARISEALQKPIEDLTVRAQESCDANNAQR